MAKCMNCGNEYEGKRADAKYCSDVCRVIFNRNITVEPVTDTVTDKPKRGKDIKCFADLPPDVQRAVGPMPADTYARRITAKPGDADYNGICTDE